MMASCKEFVINNVYICIYIQIVSYVLIPCLNCFRWKTGLTGCLASVRNREVAATTLIGGHIDNPMFVTFSL